MATRAGKTEQAVLRAALAKCEQYEPGKFRSEDVIVAIKSELPPVDIDAVLRKQAEGIYRGGRSIMAISMKTLSSCCRVSSSPTNLSA